MLVSRPPSQFLTSSLFCVGISSLLLNFGPVSRRRLRRALHVAHVRKVNTLNLLSVSSANKTGSDLHQHCFSSVSFVFFLRVSLPASQMTSSSLGSFTKRGMSQPTTKKGKETLLAHNPPKRKPACSLINQLWLWKASPHPRATKRVKNYSTSCSSKSVDALVPWACPPKCPRPFFMFGTQFHGFLLLLTHWHFGVSFNAAH